MVQAIPRSKARLTERQRFWLDHLRVCREQGHTLRGYAKTHGLSVSGLYTAHSTLKSHGVLSEPTPSAPTFVPVRITPGVGAFRVHLPNGVVVEVPAHVEGTPRYPHERIHRRSAGQGETNRAQRPVITGVMDPLHPSAVRTSISSNSRPWRG